MMGCGFGRRSRRNAKSKGNENGMYRQGDILIIPTKTIPKGLQVLRVDPRCRPILQLEPTPLYGDPQETTALNAIASTFGYRGEEYREALCAQT